MFVWEYHFLLLVCFYICNWFDGLILKLLIKLYTAKLWDKVSFVFCIFKPHFCVNRQSVDCLTFATGNGPVSGLNQSTLTNLLSAANCWTYVYSYSCLCVYRWFFLIFLLILSLQQEVDQLTGLNQSTLTNLAKLSVAADNRRTKWWKVANHLTNLQSKKDWPNGKVNRQT